MERGKEDAHFYRGLDRYLLGKLKSAIKGYTAAIAIEPNNPDYYWRRAQAWFDLNKIDKACADYTHYLQIVEDQPLPLNTKPCS